MRAKYDGLTHRYYYYCLFYACMRGRGEQGLTPSFEDRGASCTIFEYGHNRSIIRLSFVSSSMQWALSFDV